MHRGSNCLSPAARAFKKNYFPLVVKPYNWPYLAILFGFGAARSSALCSPSSAFLLVVLKETYGLIQAAASNDSDLGPHMQIVSAAVEKSLKAPEAFKKF